jgi:thymidylate synthase (FAD)
MNEIATVWATPNGDELIAHIARVSNPDNQDNHATAPKLIHTMMERGHVSPFDMVNICLEINTTRDIGRQILRHWSIKPQEFSQRYQTVDKLGDFVIREFRLQDPKNRQASVEVPADDPRAIEWERRQQRLLEIVKEDYEWCLANGGAKEVARVILPEGNTPSRLYLNGSLRSWIFYLKSRLEEGTQKEHREIAQPCLEEIRKSFPVTMEAFFGQS